MSFKMKAIWKELTQIKQTCKTQNNGAGYGRLFDDADYQNRTLMRKKSNYRRFIPSLSMSIPRKRQDYDTDDSEGGDENLRKSYSTQGEDNNVVRRIVSDSTHSRELGNTSNGDNCNKKNGATKSLVKCVQSFMRLPVLNHRNVESPASEIIFHKDHGESNSLHQRESQQETNLIVPISTLRTVSKINEDNCKQDQFQDQIMSESNDINKVNQPLSPPTALKIQSDDPLQRTDSLNECKKSETHRLSAIITSILNQPMLANCIAPIKHRRRVFNESDSESISICFSSSSSSLDLPDNELHKQFLVYDPFDDKSESIHLEEDSDESSSLEMYEMSKIYPVSHDKLYDLCNDFSMVSESSSCFDVGFSFQADAYLLDRSLLLGDEEIIFEFDNEV